MGREGVRVTVNSKRRTENRDKVDKIDKIGDYVLDQVQDDFKPAMIGKLEISRLRSE